MNSPQHEKVTLTDREEAAFMDIVRRTTLDKEQRALSATLADIVSPPSLWVIDGFQRSARRAWRN